MYCSCVVLYTHVKARCQYDIGYGKTTVDDDEAVIDTNDTAQHLH